MCHGELSVYKAAPLRIGLRDNFPLTDPPAACFRFSHKAYSVLR
jgi:hypothetical protein